MKLQILSLLRALGETRRQRARMAENDCGV
jgi:hypothetical protein